MLIKDNDAISSTSSMYSNKDEKAKIKLTNDDFEFLEKLGSSMKTSSSLNNNQTRVEKINDYLIEKTENLEIDEKKSKKKKKHSKEKSSKKHHHYSNGEEKNNEDDEDDKKKSSKKSAKNKKSSKEKRRDDDDDDDDDEDESVMSKTHVKADLDYEEL